MKVRVVVYIYYKYLVYSLTYGRCLINDIMLYSSHIVKPTHLMSANTWVSQGWSYGSRWICRRSSIESLNRVSHELMPSHLKQVLVIGYALSPITVSNVHPGVPVPSCVSVVSKRYLPGLGRCRTPHCLLNTLAKLEINNQISVSLQPDYKQQKLDPRFRTVAKSTGK